MLLHVLHDAGEPVVDEAEGVVGGDALPVVVVADAPVHEAVGDDLGQRAAVLARDQVQHHVERRDAAGAGHAVAVDGKQRLADLDAGMRLAEHRRRFPVQRHRMAVEQPRFGQRELARIDGADQRAVPVEPAQPGEQALGQVLGRMVAGEDEDVGQEGHVGDAHVGRDQHAVAGLHRRAVDGDEVRREQPLAGILVGDAQRLGRQDEGVDREFRQQQEAEILGAIRGAGTPAIPSSPSDPSPDAPRLSFLASGVKFMSCRAKSQSLF